MWGLQKTWSECPPERLQVTSLGLLMTSFACALRPRGSRGPRVEQSAGPRLSSVRVAGGDGPQRHLGGGVRLRSGGAGGHRPRAQRPCLPGRRRDAARLLRAAALKPAPVPAQVEVAVKRPCPLPLLCLAALPAALLPAAAPPAGPPPAEVAGLIGRLGDDDFAVREAATSRLMLAGDPALDALYKALASDDPEVRHRARRIVAAIEARLYPELRLVGHTALVTRVCVSADGQRLLTSSYDKTLRLWDAYTGRCLRVFKGHTAAIFGAALSPDGK